MRVTHFYNSLIATPQMMLNHHLIFLFSMAGRNIYLRQSKPICKLKMWQICFDSIRQQVFTRKTISANAVCFNTCNSWRKPTQDEHKLSCGQSNRGLICHRAVWSCLFQLTLSVYLLLCQRKQSTCAICGPTRPTHYSMQIAALTPNLRHRLELRIQKQGCATRTR